MEYLSNNKLYQFLIKQDLFDVIIGTTFGFMVKDLVTSLVQNIIAPIIEKLMPPAISNQSYEILGIRFKLMTFLHDILAFVVTLVALFYISQFWLATQK